MVLKYHFNHNNDLGHYDAPALVKEIARFCFLKTETPFLTITPGAGPMYWVLLACKADLYKVSCELAECLPDGINIWITNGWI